MLKLALLVVAASLTFPLCAQQGAPGGKDSPKSDAKAEEASPAEERLRVEGAAGGTRPEPEKKRKAAGSGAGPHLRDNLPSPAKLPRDKPVEPPK